jgi:hypothetical protein
LNDQSDAPVNLPAVGIQLTHRLDDYREIVFQGHVPANCSDMQFNDLLDKLSRVGERQKALAALPTHKGVLDEMKAEQLVKTAEAFQLTQELARQDEAWRRQATQDGRRNPRLSPAQSQERLKTEGQIKQLESELSLLQKKIVSVQGLVSLYESRISQEA